MKKLFTNENILQRSLLKNEDDFISKLITESTKYSSYKVYVPKSALKNIIKSKIKTKL